MNEIPDVTEQLALMKRAEELIIECGDIPGERLPAFFLFASAFAYEKYMEEKADEAMMRNLGLKGGMPEDEFGKIVWRMAKAILWQQLIAKCLPSMAKSACAVLEAYRLEEAQ